MKTSVTIPESTVAVITASSFSLSPEPYLFVKAGKVDHTTQHLAVMHDRLDTTVITTESKLGSVEVLARNADRWTLISIVCANPFYCIGFIAAIATAFTQASVDFCFLSAFTQDLVLVKEADRERAADLLATLGFKRT